MAKKDEPKAKSFASSIRNAVQQRPAGCAVLIGGAFVIAQAQAGWSTQ